MKKLLILAAGAALIAPLAACSGNTITNTPTAPAAAAAVTTAPAGAAKFGQTVTFPDGIKVTVAPAIVTAGQYASGAVAGKIVTMTVTVTNGSKTAFSATLMGVPTVTYGTKGISAPMAVDSSINAAILSTILPGKSQTAVSGYGIPAADLTDVQAQINSPTLIDPPAIFEGAVK